MFTRLFRFAAIAACLVFPIASNAADPKTDAPTVLVRIQSVNDLIKTGQYVATLLPDDGREQVKQGLDFVKSLIDDAKGIEGIGVKNPIGMYATLTAELTSSPVVVLIPIADEKTVMDALKTRANVEPKKRDDGSYEVQPQGAPVTVFFRFANNYAYVTANDPENIAVKNLPKPETVLGGRPEHLISASIRIDRLPEQMKKMALGFIENKLAEGKDQPERNESDEGIQGPDDRCGRWNAEIPS
jgi:hypothetical protein